MLSPILAADARTNPATGALLKLSRPSTPGAGPAAPGEGALAERFQDFAAGTFYKTMLKSLRSGQKPPKYMYGGQTEEIFRKHLDDQLAENLAREHGAHLSAPLFEQYSRQLNRQSPASTEDFHALDAAA